MNKLNNTKIEFHILQSFPVSCLNRDDVGSPKSAFVGGVNRARVSSQCWKRQIRLTMHDLGLTLGIRTKNIEKLLKDSILKLGASEENAAQCAESLAKEISDDTLVFVSDTEINTFAKYAKEHEFKTENFSNDLAKLIKTTINKNLDALDISLFGRMVAKSADMNVEAASCFNHAISTHAVASDIDYFTALDDYAKGEQGAAHLGSAEFNSATYYRYVCLDLGILAHNLGISNFDEDKDIIKQAVEYFTKALVLAVPPAKQNTMSAQSTWDYAKILIREGQPMQLSFENPVRNKGEGYLRPSIEELKNQISTKQKLLGSLYSSKKELEWGIDPEFSIDNLISDLKESI